jgi:hypothetical protein
MAVFERLGYGALARSNPLEACLEGKGKVPLRLRLIQRGRIFGGAYVLETATAEPVLPPTRGLAARVEALSA